MTDVTNANNKTLTGYKDTYESLKDEANSVGNEIKDKAIDVAKVARDQAISINDDAIGFIKENPYKTVIAALFTGFLIAKLI